MLEYHLAKAQWMASHSSVHSGPLHTYPDIFESTTISFRFKIFHVHTYPFSNRICHSTRIRIHSSAQDSSGNTGNRACVVTTGKGRVKSTRENFGTEVAILNTVFTVKNWVESCYVTGKISGFSIHTIPYS